MHSSPRSHSCETLLQPPKCLAALACSHVLQQRAVIRILDFFWFVFIKKRMCCMSVCSSVSPSPRVRLCAGLSEDRLARFALDIALRRLLLQHLLVDLRVTLQGLLLLLLLASGLHPGDQTEHRSSDDRGDARQVESHVVTAQSVPQESCQHTQTRRMNK